MREPLVCVSCKLLITYSLFFVFLLIFLFFILNLKENQTFHPLKFVQPLGMTELWSDLTFLLYLFIPEEKKRLRKEIPAHLADKCWPAQVYV